MSQAAKPDALSFQDIILTLQRYWADLGCVVLQPYDNEVGAGTNDPATTLRSLGPDTWRTCYVQRCRRPTDGRYGENPNRTQYLLPVPGAHEALSGQRPGALPGQPACYWHRYGEARRPLRRGRLGEPDAWRMGPWMGSLDRWHGGHPVHVFPAGRRIRMQSRSRGNRLRS